MAKFYVGDVIYRKEGAKELYVIADVTYSGYKIRSERGVYCGEHSPEYIDSVYEKVGENMSYTTIPEAYNYTGNYTGRIAGTWSDPNQLPRQPVGQNIITASTPTNKKGIKMTIKAIKDKVSLAVKPYEKYITIAAIVLVVDHFILGGKMRKEVTGVAQKIINKLLEKLHSFADSL